MHLALGCSASGAGPSVAVPCVPGMDVAVCAAGVAVFFVFGTSFGIAAFGKHAPEGLLDHTDSWGTLSAHVVAAKGARGERVSLL